MENNIVVQQTSVLDAGSNAAELFLEWSKHIRGADRTKDTYIRNTKQFIMYLYERGIRHPQEQDVEDYLDYLMQEHKPATVNSYRQGIRSFFRWTEKQGLYENIAKDVKGQKVDAGHAKEALTAKQAKALLDSIDRSTLKGKRDYAMLSLMLTAGLRTVEVIRADRGDLRTKTNPKTGEDFLALYVQGKGRTDKKEYVKVAPQVEKALNEYLTARGTVNGEEPLFSSTAHRNTGGRLTTRSISRIVKDQLVSIGLDSNLYTAHCLRHTTATLNLLGEGTLQETMELMRHKNPETTLIYAHNLDRAESKSEERVAGAIFA